jgi:hypothetical protein
MASDFQIFLIIRSRCNLHNQLHAHLKNVCVHKLRNGSNETVFRDAVFGHRPHRFV